MKRAAVVLLFAVVTSAQARFANVPLADVVKRSPLIADVTITSSRIEEWTGRDRRRICGTVYVARVNEVLKGEAGTTITFASNDQYEPASRQLLFIYSSTEDFPKDVIEHLPEAEERDRQRCLKTLPALKTTFLDRASFLDTRYVRLSYHLVPPPEIHAATVTISEVDVNGRREPFPGDWKKRSEEAYALFLPYYQDQVVSWTSLREWISREVNTNAR